MPYLLPSDPDISELDCVLVYFPNAPEYRQALFGQLAELSDVWNWEGTREAQALARASWLAAELETLNNMSCFDDVLAELQAINAKLPWCCDTSPPTIEIDPVEGPGGILIWPVPGPAPLPIPDNDTGEGTGEYPITPGTDPDDGGTVSAVEWEQYLCGAANFLIDSLIDWLRFVRFQRRFTSQLGSSVRWLQAFIAGRLIPGVMDDFALFQLDDLIDEIVNAFENVFIEDLDTAITQLGNIRDSAVCAIVGENTAANAINALLNFLSGEITNAFVMSLLGSPATLIASLIWNGALDTDWDTGCDCVVTGEIGGFGFTCTNFQINGANNTNTTIVFRTLSSAISPVLFESGSPATMANAGLFNTNGSYLTVAGTTEALAAVVAVSERGISYRTGLNPSCHAILNVLNGTGSTQQIDITLTVPRLFNQDTGNWQDASLAQVSADSGFTITAGQITFSASMGAGAGLTAVVELEYS